MRIMTAALVLMATGGAASAQSVDLDSYRMRTFQDVVTVCASEDEQAGSGVAIAVGTMAGLCTVVIGGAATVAVAMLWGRLFPDLRDRDRLIA